MFELGGKSAVVAGAASGIGRASAAGLADFGAHVVCADVDAEGVERTAREIVERGGRAEAIVVDIEDPASVERAAGHIGTPDILVTTPSKNVRKPLLEISDDEFDQVVSLNLKGTFRLIRAFAGGMAERGSGSVIAFASFRALVVEPGQSIYAATKAGTVQMLRGLAAELGPRGVRVNSIAPGAVETPLTAQIKQQPEWHRAYAEKSVFRRWAGPEEMVGAVVFLASEASSYVTGSLMMVDGGWTAADGRFDPPL
jgi:NAD(P)-dependent dehydrogenase (short-subunit alcohol dehydrogenase family)